MNTNRFFLTILMFFLSLAAGANMASPIEEGTWMASPFISKHVDIVKENILMVPDADFESARFEIEYHIKADTSGKQIPLLFYASDFNSDFKVWIDGRAVKIKQIPRRYKALEGTPFSDFAHLFETNRWSKRKEVHIKESDLRDYHVYTDELKYFETDMSEGEHVVRVEYVANQWIDRSDWVLAYSFRYVLSPAAYWKSFGDLEITLDASQVSKELTTSLGPPTEGDIQSKAIWRFNELPTEVFHVTHVPPISQKANTLLKLKPLGIAAIITLILVLMHALAIKLYRKKNPAKRFSMALLVGCLLVPLLSLLVYKYSFAWIDSVIGEAASRFHGYVFLVLFFYPVYLMIYGLVMWPVDSAFKKKGAE